MASQALSDWENAGAARLDHLLAALPAEPRPGQAQAVVDALTLLLAAEFQRFARDLHDEAARALVGAAAPEGTQLNTALSGAVTARRELSYKNAQPDVLKDDFARLGIAHLWDALSMADAQASADRGTLKTLQKYRNGLAHADESKLDGYRPSVEDWAARRAALVRLARALDAVVERHVRRLVVESSGEET